MHGTLVKKISRLGANLCLHPKYIPRYAVQSVIGRKSPTELELPWFAYGAIDFLEEFLEPHMTVCEYGSGGSTIFFAQRCKRVFSIEDNPQWFNLISSRLHAKAIHNVTLELRPFDFKNPVGFEHSEYLHAIPNEVMDVIVVDGTEESTPVRPICFAKAESRINKNGIIIVDDSWRYPEIRRCHTANRCLTFKSVGPARFGVTSTDIFYY